MLMVYERWIKCILSEWDICERPVDSKHESPELCSCTRLSAALFVVYAFVYVHCFTACLCIFVRISISIRISHTYTHININSPI